MLRRTLIAGALILLSIALPAAAASDGNVPPAGSPFTTRAVNQAVARTWAARLLGDLKLPPSAVRSAGAPPGSGKSLSAPGFSLTSAQLVDDTSWWTIEEPAAAVVAEVRSQLPHGLRLVGHGVGGEPGRVTDGFWSYAAPAGLSELTAAVQTDALKDDETAVRLDGEATWLVPRPGWDRIPSSVSSVSFTARATGAGLDGARPSRGPRSAPRTLGRRDARRLATAIDGLQRMQPGVVFSCPLDAVEPRITLRFQGPGGAPLAVAVDQPSGCATVGLTVGRRRGPVLDDMTGDPLPIDEQMVALGAIRPCRTGQLAAGPASIALAARRPTLTLSVRDRSDSVCTVRGYPRITLVGSSGRVITGRRHDIDPGALRRTGISGSVILYPGTSAQFTARYTTCPKLSPAVSAQIRITPAGDALLEPLARTGRRVTPCLGTVMRVSAFSPAL